MSRFCSQASLSRVGGLGACCYCCVGGCGYEGVGAYAQMHISIVFNDWVNIQYMRAVLSRPTHCNPQSKGQPARVIKI